MLQAYFEEMSYLRFGGKNEKLGVNWQISSHFLPKNLLPNLENNQTTQNVFILNIR